MPSSSQEAHIKCISSIIRQISRMRCWGTCLQCFQALTQIKISSNKNSNSCKITSVLCYKTHWWPKLRWRSRNLLQQVQRTAKSLNHLLHRGKELTVTLPIRATHLAQKPMTKGTITAKVLRCRVWLAQLLQSLHRLSLDCWRHLLQDQYLLLNQTWEQVSWGKDLSATTLAIPFFGLLLETPSNSKKMPKPNWPNQSWSSKMEVKSLTPLKSRLQKALQTA